MGRSRDDGAALGWLGPVLAIGAVALIALLSFGRVTAVLGDSDEGINGAVWATNSRALRDAGPIDSRMGGIRLDGTKYATHPPGLVAETAVAETIGGENEWATRAAAWIGSLVALFLLYRLLRAARFGSLVAGGATAITALSPMLLVYGSMLDTPVTAFPFGVAVVLVWFRQWSAPPATRPTNWLLIGLLCVLAGLSGWQAVVLVALCGGSLAARTLRKRDGALLEALPFLVGGAIGLGLSLAWTRWTYGDFSVLAGKYSTRTSGTSGSGGGIGDMVGFQIPWLIQLLGVGLIGFGGCIAALWNRFLRPLAAMSLGIVGLYALIFHQAAGGHQYWNYWALLPTAIGAGYVLDRIARDAAANAPVIVTALVALAAVINLAVWPDSAVRYIEDGHRVTVAYRNATYPPDQDTAWYVGESYHPDAWIGYYSDRSPMEIATTDQLRQLAAATPDALVIVLDSCLTRPAPSEVCTDLEQAEKFTGAERIVTARDLLAAT